MLAKEIEKQGIPVVLFTAMIPLAKQVGAHRIVKGVKIPHPWGDPSLSPENNQRIEEKIFQAALDLLQREVQEPVVFQPV